jgi:hypothetical protein
VNAAEINGLPGAASAVGHVARDTAIGTGETVVLGGTIMGGASLTGTSVTTSGGVALAGFGGAATVGSVTVIGGAAGYGLGYGIGSIPIGRHTIHEHLGEGIYYVSAAVYDAGAAIGGAATNVWNWATSW